MEDTKVSDIEEIGKLTNLEELDLSATRVKSLPPLAGYASYTYAGSQSNYEGLKKLNTLKLYGIKEISGSKFVKEKLLTLLLNQPRYGNRLREKYSLF